MHLNIVGINMKCFVTHCKKKARYEVKVGYREPIGYCEEHFWVVQRPLNSVYHVSQVRQKFWRYSYRKKAIDDLLGEEDDREDRLR